MKRRSVAVLSAGIIGSSLVLAGCGSTSTPSTGSSQAVKSPMGNVAVVALTPQTSPNWWFPVVASTAYSDLNSQMQSLMYVPLIHISKTDGIDYKRSLASNVTWNSTGTVYTITLNKKWHWSNGQPVTSADVVWTTQLMLAASSGASSLPWGYGGAGIGGIPTRWKSVTADGPYKVIVTLTQPSNPQWFLHNGLGQILPAPKSVWDIHKNIDNELKFIQSVSNDPGSQYYNVVDGAFKFDAAASKTNNQYWTFVPNPNYDGHKASISKLIYKYETSSSAEFADLKTQKVNVGFLPPSLWNSRGELTADKFSTVYLFGFNYLQPNYNSKAPGGFGQIISHRYVREALEMGIDQQGMINSFYHGHGVVEFGPIPSKPPTQFDDPNLTNPAPFNPQAGKKLLEEHGWKLVNGVMTKNGQKLAFTLDYVSGSNTITDQVQLMKQDWAQEGIQVTLLSQPFDTIISDANQGDPTKWQLDWWGGGWTYEPDYYPTGGGLFGTGSAANYGGYSSSTMDSLIKKTYEPGTASQITARMDAYQAWAVKDLPVIWVPWTPTFSEVATYVHGVNSAFNPIEDLNYPNYWTINH
ncbi:peptide ABC transporter substrate-binding protein [Sulfobacillus thermosulfidooxidans]|uniref:peptide ABC transporter substrate-binding protein n=1 Tax=Sulfobacillus thermosulfidooxidans TaxID=28034 RepID=UPI0006B44FC9|nr:peptide ABC transporter substrate-binding protein [Sulfobacillus thermosulfidooxidans]